MKKQTEVRTLEATIQDRVMTRLGIMFDDLDLQKQCQYISDYHVARREFKLQHRQGMHSADYVTKWISHYMHRHYGYKVRDIPRENKERLQ